MASLETLTLKLVKIPFVVCSACVSSRWCVAMTQMLFSSEAMRLSVARPIDAASRGLVPLNISSVMMSANWLGERFWVSRNNCDMRAPCILNSDFFKAGLSSIFMYESRRANGVNDADVAGMTPKV